MPGGNGEMDTERGEGGGNPMKRLGVGGTSALPVSTELDFLV